MSAWGSGLNRSRSKLGAWIDHNEITQGELHRWSGISRPTVTKLCGDQDYRPNGLTRRTLIHALRDRGYSVGESDFW